jgi:hypothetical protein
MLWLMVADVNAGREHMNLSNWGRYRLGEQLARLSAISEMVRKDKMPLLVLPAAAPLRFSVRQ